MAAAGLRCFVAMRLGDPDLDALYARSIAPIVRGHGMTPRQMNQITHNERIDRKIEKELDRCALAIADLTYARPSVYYEAGYVERAKPVIYTCRRDHFKPRADDDAGNYRVHFDLQTKNIIRWQTPTDREFQRKLRARLQYVARPLVAAQRKQAAEEQAAAVFTGLGVGGQLRRLKRVAVNLARRVGFNVRAFSVGAKEVLLDPEWAALTRDGVRAQRREGRRRHRADVFVLDHPGKRLLARLRHHVVYDIRDIYDMEANSRRGEPTRRVDHCLLVTAQKVPAGTVAAVFSMFRPAPEIGARTWVNAAPLPSSVIDREGTRTAYLHVIDRVRSEEMARSALRETFDRVRLSR